MTYSEVLYHGTYKESAESIINSQEFKYDKIDENPRDDHWLGNGIYFYEEEFHAFKWVWYLKNNKQKEKDITIDDEDILNHCSIVKVEVEVDESRVFDLTKIRYKLIFERIYKWINKKIELSNDFKERLKEDGACAEGVIFNFMFGQMKDSKLDYLKRFDLVKALFPIPNRKYNNILKEEIKSCLKITMDRKNYKRRMNGKPPLNPNEMNLDDLIYIIAEALNSNYKYRKYRITFMPEIQVCIKNPNILVWVILHSNL